MVGEFFLTSERLGFRKWKTGDLEFAEKLWGDPLVTQFIDAREELTEADILNKLRTEIDRGDLHYWPVFNLSDSDFVGCCGLREYKAEERILEIGFHICSDKWRKGFASEAALRVIDYAFNQLWVNGLFAGHNPANKSSAVLLNKLGFKYTHDEYYEPTGLQHPSYILMNRRRE